MEYRRFNNNIVLRIDKGEEVLETIKKVAMKENIKFANINELGATNSFTVGVFNASEKKYYINSFQWDFEIVSLTLSINTMNGEFYSHLHMSCGDDTGKVFGGHLNKCIVLLVRCLLIYLMIVLIGSLMKIQV